MSMPELEMRCPGCGVEPGRRPPCRICGLARTQRCCDCYHDDDDPNDPSLTPSQRDALVRHLTRRGILPDTTPTTPQEDQ